MESVVARAGSAFFTVTYVLLLGAALYHGLYGLRNILLELNPGAGLRKAVNVCLTVLRLGLFVFGTWRPSPRRARPRWEAEVTATDPRQVTFRLRRFEPGTDRQHSGSGGAPGRGLAGHDRARRPVEGERALACSVARLALVVPDGHLRLVRDAGQRPAAPRLQHPGRPSCEARS